MSKALRDKLEELAGKQAEEMTEALFDAARDGDDSAVDLIMDAAAGAGMCTILEMKVIMTSKGVTVTTGGSKPIRNFFEDRIPKANEIVKDYAEKALDLGTELVKEIKPLMTECGMLLKEEKEK